jgi:4-amino-4-deoxy-L-arabinose transferase-like glycosyltransferase
VGLNGAATMFWPPGYPFLLTAVYRLYPEGLLGGGEVTAALVVNALLGTASVLLVYAIAGRAFDRSVALLAALLTTVFPSLIFLAGVMLSETLFIFLALLGVWLIIEAEQRKTPALLVPVGLVIGWAALTRGQAALLPLVACVFWWRALGDWRQVASRVLIVGGLVALVLAPWAIRNYVESNSFVPVSSNAGVDFFIGHSEGADGRGRKVDELVFRYPGLPQPEAEAKVNADGFREGFEFLVTHPLREVELLARKLFYLYYNDHEAIAWTEGHGAQRFMPDAARVALAGLSNAYYMVILALSVGGIGLWLSWREPVRLLLVSLVVYWTLVHLAFFGDPRFHAPILPLLSIWAGCSTIALWRWAKGIATASKVSADAGVRRSG